MQIAKAMEDFPDLQWDKMKNKKEASKVVQKIYSSIGRMENAKKVEKELGTGDARKKKLYDSFMIGDFFELIEQIPNGYFDLVEVDPPYAIDLTKKKKGYGYEGYNEVEKEKYEDFLFDTIRKCYDKMAENSWLIFWFGPDPWFQVIREMLEHFKFGTTGLVGIWVKGEDKEGGITATGQTHMPNKRLANAYEMFYYAWKGAPNLARPGRSNIFGHAPVPHTRKTHPTEKPQELIDDILTTFGVEGNKVLVPFAGSGTTLISAAKNNMIPLGFDLTQAYKDSYILRVNEMF
jgi:site-specific DNA-methyltransferase (adenine-specific)